MPKIVIEYTMPAGVKREDIASFVYDALSSWGGQFHPDDSLFGSLRGLMTTITVNRKKFDAREQLDDDSGTETGSNGPNIRAEAREGD